MSEARLLSANPPYKVGYNRSLQSGVHYNAPPYSISTRTSIQRLKVSPKKRRHGKTGWSPHRDKDVRDLVGGRDSAITLITSKPDIILLFFIAN